MNYEQIPYGTGVEIITAKALEVAQLSAVEEYDREHVTPYIKSHMDLFALGVLVPENKELRRPDISLTVDTMADYVKVYKLICNLDLKETISLAELIEKYSKDKLDRNFQMNN
ncbi:hypothetical protein D3C73_1245390 [compost metagenome]